jgi:hypothetical protein
MMRLFCFRYCDSLGSAAAAPAISQGNPRNSDRNDERRQRRRPDRIQSSRGVHTKVLSGNPAAASFY